MGRSKVKMQAPAEEADHNKRMRIVALPVDPIQLSEVIAREVCRQHGATYKGHRFRSCNGVFEVAAIGIVDGLLGQAIIVGEPPADAKGEASGER